VKHRVSLHDGATGWGNCSICGDVYLKLRPAKLRKSGEVWVCPETLKRKVKTKAKKPKGTTIRNKCDTEWSLLVRERDGYKCQLEGFEKDCGGAMQAHHLVGRTEESTRWVPENGVCLCYSHHIYGVHGGKSTLMNHELLKRLPEGRMDELNTMRRLHRDSKTKIDKSIVLARLIEARKAAA
jgi:5-methylcytosine-specific restriction endonuclease McrA